MTSGLPIAVPLLVGTADTQRQHVLGVFQFPPSAGPLETVLDDVTVCTFDFAGPYWQPGHERVLIVELPRAIGEIAMRRAHRGVGIALALIRIDPFLLTKADPRRGVGERRDVSPG